METVEKPKERKMWKLLIPHDRAESLLKRARILGAEGKTQRSIKSFKQTVKLLAEIERFLDVKHWKTEDPEEIELINKMKNTVRPKREYCLAGIIDEENNDPRLGVEPRRSTLGQPL